MKILYVISALILVLIPVTAFSENPSDVIYLKDGSVIRGTIVEEIPEESYKVEIAGRSVLALSADEVEKVERGSPVRTTGVEKSISSADKRPLTGKRLFIGVNAVIGYVQAWEGEPLIGVETYLGPRIYDIYVPAIGFGYNKVMIGELNIADYSPSNITYDFIHFYIHNRFTFARTGGVGLYGNFDIGYGFGSSRELYSDRPGGLTYGFGQGFELGSKTVKGDLGVSYRKHSFLYSGAGGEILGHFGLVL